MHWLDIFQFQFFTLEIRLDMLLIHVYITVIGSSLYSCFVTLYPVGNIVTKKNIAALKGSVFILFKYLFHFVLGFTLIDLLTVDNSFYTCGKLFLSALTVLILDTERDTPVAIIDL